MVDLKEYPLAEELRKSLTTAVALEAEMLTLDISVARIKAKVENEVCGAVNEAGKPLYSNETLRTAAVTIALEEHDRYEDFTATIRYKAHQRAIALAEAEALRNAIRLACATARVEAD